MSNQAIELKTDSAVFQATANGHKNWEIRFNDRGYEVGDWLVLKETKYTGAEMKKGKQPRIFKFGEQKRDFIYVKDVAKITIEALNARKSAIVNVGTGTPRSFNDIIVSLNKTMQLDLKPDYFDNLYA